jgi:hypothetical protein
MSQNEPQAAARDELAALDHILAGDPVGEEHLDLAALVESVRADAPRIDAAFGVRLEQLVADRTVPRSSRHGMRAAVAATRRRRATLAGGGLAAALGVSLAVIVAVGALSSPSGTRNPLPEARHALTGPAAPLSGAAGSAAPGENFTTTEGTTASTTAKQATNPLNPNDQLIQHAASLTLATAPSQMQGVANEVVSSTEDDGGVVEHSNVAVHGPSSYASFSLSVPAAKLSQLLSSLSSLAGVRALTQSTQNLTSSYDDATTKLADERSERAALIAALARAQSTAQADQIQQRVDKLDAAIAATHVRVGALLSEGHNSNVQVDIVAGGAGAGHSSGGPITRALDNALAVLDVILAIALVALAILVPVALCVLAVWWSGATLRQRARERAVSASAP